MYESNVLGTADCIDRVKEIDSTEANVKRATATTGDVLKIRRQRATYRNEMQTGEASLVPENFRPPSLRNGIGRKSYW